MVRGKSSQGVVKRQVEERSEGRGERRGRGCGEMLAGGGVEPDISPILRPIAGGVGGGVGGEDGFVELEVGEFEPGGTLVGVRLMPLFIVLQGVEAFFNSYMWIATVESLKE